MLDAEMMQPEMLMSTFTKMGPKAFGSTWRQMICAFVTPAARAASTYSFCTTPITIERTMRAVPGTLVTTSAMMMPCMPRPMTATRASMSRSDGMHTSESMMRMTTMSNVPPKYAHADPIAVR